jgi:hypothetical protein
MGPHGNVIARESRHRPRFSQASRRSGMKWSRSSEARAVAEQEIPVGERTESGAVPCVVDIIVGECKPEAPWLRADRK